MEDPELAEDVEGDVDKDIWSNNSLFALDTPQIAAFRQTKDFEAMNKRSKLLNRCNLNSQPDSPNITSA